MLAYYWVLVTPSVAFIFGAYLYLSVNWFHVHYDEAFSSLQIPHHKGFSRIHITPEGDLHVYGLAIDKVPTGCFLTRNCSSVLAPICAICETDRTSEAAKAWQPLRPSIQMGRAAGRARRCHVAFSADPFCWGR